MMLLANPPEWRNERQRELIVCYDKSKDVNPSEQVKVRKRCLCNHK